MVKSFVSSKELRLTLIFAKVTQFQNWQNDELCKQRNRVIFLVLVPMNLLWVTHYTRLLLGAWFAVGGQRTDRAGAGAFEHHGWDWWKLRLELQSCWVMRKEEEINSAIFCKFISHILFYRLAKYHAEEKTLWPLVPWQPCVEELLPHPAPFPCLGSMVQRGREITWKRERGLTLMWSPGGKPVASIRTLERLSALSKMLSRKYMEKVIWSVCKNSSPFPFSSHSFTVWQLTSEDTLVQRWQQKETEQCGWEALWEAEISFSLMSVGFPAHLHCREVGTPVWIPLQPLLHYLDTHNSSKSCYGKAKELKKLPLVCLKKCGMEKVALTQEVSPSTLYFSIYLKFVI